MKSLMMIITILFAATSIYAAVGCDLNDPDKDVKRLFPSSTGYKTTYRSIQREGGKTLLSAMENRLGDEFSGLYETIDVPYTLYEVYQGEKSIGYIHGVNQRGRYGGIQIFLVLDSKGIIRDVYFQRLSSRNKTAFRSENFAGQFKGLAMKDWDTFNIKTGKGTGKAAAIKTPVSSEDPDFLAIMRGIKKNLVLMEHFGSYSKILEK